MSSLAEKIDAALDRFGPDSTALAMVVRDVLNLHAPRQYSDGTQLQCGHCADNCHSFSGLGCDSPDARWPCSTVRAVTSGLEVADE